MAPADVSGAVHVPCLLLCEHTDSIDEHCCTTHGLLLVYGGADRKCAAAIC